jgi:hypothetical protein
MENTTVTIWVRPTDFKYFLEVLKIISELPDNYFEYEFRAKDINYSTGQYSAWTQINIPILLYLKWEICYKTNEKKN